MVALRLMDEKRNVFLLRSSVSPEGYGQRQIRKGKSSISYAVANLGARLSISAEKAL